MNHEKREDFRMIPNLLVTVTERMELTFTKMKNAKRGWVDDGGMGAQ